MSDTVFVGLDGEMSGANIEDGHVLIQIGAAVRVNNTVDTFSSLLKVDSRGEGWWDERAAKVHNIPIEKVDGAPPAAEVDSQLAGWLLERGAIFGRRFLVPVGFNVVAFDMPFVRQALPETAELFSRRGVDLNALMYAAEGWDPNPRNATRKWSGWKRSAKKAVAPQVDVLCPGVTDHDAGYDAVQALLIFEWMRTQMLHL